MLNCTKEASQNSHKKLIVTTLKALPEPTTNNAVSEGFIKGKPYIFTFGGLDSTKRYTGIHKRSYKYDVHNSSWQQIAELPDTLGKIASAAHRIKDTIYIIGGYHVFKDHTEKSSNKVHRYDIVNNEFLENGAAIPIAIDDHVQTVWRDSLIYITTGWSDVKNVPNVQIYNPSSNSWSEGTSVPNNHTYKSFGASGTIISDTIFYFGGASMGKNYPIQNVLRKGIINPKKPTEISWSHEVIDSTIVGYRMTATSVNNKPHWLGGSTTTYNYNPIAYNGSGGVHPSNRDLSINKEEWRQNFGNKLPMDLRGIAEINDSTKILVGGITENQQVSNKVYLLEWKEQ
jgi:N-acetylneuraminic acid mutarotase